MRKSLIISALSILIISCNSGGDLLEKLNDFDQGPMLENIGDNIILPSYQNLSASTLQLSENVNSLTENRSVDALKEVRASLKSARLNWQYCSPFQFGPAETYAISAVLNIYPVDVNQIERNLTAGTYDLSTLSNSDARGFQTLGYFLYSSELSDEELLASYTDEELTYMRTVAEEIATVSSEVYTAWSVDGGNYIATFTSEEAYGVNVGSSVGKMINAMNLDFERNTRDGKIGIPAGVRSLGEPILNATEAYYAGYSVELFEASIDAYYTLYTGGNGVGLDDYLKAIEATTTANEDLSVKIDSQFKTIQNIQLTDPLPDQITTNIDPVLEVFVEMQQLIVMFKTDMASSMGVVITYQDNDGD